jgi:hypothetical protein
MDPNVQTTLQAELMRVEENEQRAGEFVYSGNSTTMAAQLSNTLETLVGV